MTTRDREICEAATPGARVVDFEGYGANDTPKICTVNGGILFMSTHHGLMREDSQFVAHFNPERVAKMLDVIEAAENVARERLKDSQYPENFTLPPRFMFDLIKALERLGDD